MRGGRTEVGTVRGSMVLDKFRECVALEEAGVFGKQAKEDAYEKAFEVVSGIAAVFEGVVQFAQELDSPNVDRVFHVELVLLVAGDEGELSTQR